MLSLSLIRTTPRTYALKTWSSCPSSTNVFGIVTHPSTFPPTCPLAPTGNACVPGGGFTIVMEGRMKWYASPVGCLIPFVESVAFVFSISHLSNATSSTTQVKIFRKHLLESPFPPSIAKMILLSASKAPSCLWYASCQFISISLLMPVLHP